MGALGRGNGERRDGRRAGVVSGYGGDRGRGVEVAFRFGEQSISPWPVPNSMNGALNGKAGDGGAHLARPWVLLPQSCTPVTLFWLPFSLAL
jgi:hypothetical protein